MKTELESLNDHPAGICISRALFLMSVYLPCLWLALLAAFVLGVTAMVGHFPTYGQPDPKDTGMLQLLYLPLIALTATMPAVIIFGLLLLAVRHWSRSLFPVRKRDVLLLLSGAILYLGIAANDLAGLMTWLAD